ncbi:hypothetical protein Hanom_Chr05g00389661 [Helianthus anomalus]
MYRGQPPLRLGAKKFDVFSNKIDPTNDKENMGYVESTTRRLDLENMDYGGTGANDRHDPKSPGRA